MSQNQLCLLLITKLTQEWRFIDVLFRSNWRTKAKSMNHLDPRVHDNKKFSKSGFMSVKVIRFLKLGSFRFRLSLGKLNTEGTPRETWPAVTRVCVMWTLNPYKELYSSFNYCQFAKGKNPARVSSCTHCPYMDTSQFLKNLQLWSRR